jgi:hypothetical protein
MSGSWRAARARREGGVAVRDGGPPCFSLSSFRGARSANPEFRDSPMRSCASEVRSFGPSRNDSVSLPSFRDAPLGAGPESITTTGRMDSGQPLHGLRNDDPSL